MKTKEDLFKKYHIDESHNVWDRGIDSWMSIEVYRIMHNGNLPTGDPTIKWVCDFLDKPYKDMKWWVKNVMSRADWGSLFLTSKRMVYMHHEQILKELA